MVSLALQLKLIEHGSLGGLHASGLLGRLPFIISVKALGSVAALVEACLVARQLAQGSCAPRERSSRLLQMSVSSIFHLGLIGLLVELQVGGMMPFSKTLKLFLLFCSPGSKRLHRAPVLADWCKPKFIWYFSIKSRQKLASVGWLIKVPSSLQ